jgi:hypothetical protein
MPHGEKLRACDSRVTHLTRESGFCHNYRIDRNETVDIPIYSTWKPAPHGFKPRFLLKMAYYNSDFEIGDSWYEANASSYPSRAPGTEYAVANAAAFTTG